MSEEKALAIAEPTQKLAIKRQPSFAPQNLTEALAFCKMMAKSLLIPKDFQGKPENILIAVQMGSEIGLAPMQAIQSIAVINGRPAVWGDALVGIVQAHPAYEWHKETIEGTGDTRKGVCIVKRRGAEAHRVEFSVPDAVKAKLWGKVGPWTQYPDRMLQQRARGFAFRDQFADALKGIITAEEAQDMPLPIPAPERASIDYGKELATLSESSEPNRGHDATGLDSPSKPTVDSKGKCSGCGAIGGHLPSCALRNPSQKPQEATPEETVPEPQPKQEVVPEPKPAKKKAKTAKGVVHVAKITPKIKGADQPYFILSCQAPGHEGEYEVWAWHKTYQPYLPSMLYKDCEVTLKQTPNESGGLSYALEEIHRVGDTPFVGNKPVEAEGVLEAEEVPEGLFQTTED